MRRILKRFTGLFCVLALSISLSHVPLKSLFRGMKPVVFILIFTAVLNLFYTPGGRGRALESINHSPLG